MSSALVPRPSSVRPVSARDLLQKATLDEAKETREQAIAYEAFARARHERDEYQRAGEAKLWAERRIGELRRDSIDNRGHASEIDREVGLTSFQGSRLVKMASIPVDTFARILGQIVASDGAFNANGVLSRAGQAYEQRLEYGIYRVAGGRLALQYRFRGVKHRKVLSHTSLTRAREELAEATERWKAPKPDGSRGPDAASNHVRHSLAAIAGVSLSGQSPEVRKAVDRAMAALYKAGDDLLFVVNNWDLKS